MPKAVAAILCSFVLGIAVIGAPGQSTQQPQFTTLTADFVPGEKTLFFDDFSDMAPGDPPKRFKVRGAAPELRAAGDARELAFVRNGVLIPNLTTLPKNFTLETEINYQAPNGSAMANVLLLSKEREALTLLTRLQAGRMTLALSTKVPKYEEFGRAAVKHNASVPTRLALWVQDGRVRVFVDGEKQIDVNQVDVAPVDRVELRGEVGGTGPSVGFRTIRFAESAPDVTQVLTASGRYVSHAIRFDTDSDRLKPESAAPIQAIAKALRDTPALTLLIEGHTDASGDAARNLDLSKRRAEAVKTVLVSQFGIDAARLTTTGLGATTPIESNDTPQGRAQNRRVEFVKK